MKKTKNLFALLPIATLALGIIHSCIKDESKLIHAAGKGAALAGASDGFEKHSDTDGFLPSVGDIKFLRGYRIAKILSWITSSSFMEIDLDKTSGLMPGTYAEGTVNKLMEAGTVPVRDV